MRFQETVPHFSGGVSKQSAQLRSPSQFEEVYDSWTDTAQGLLKRPPFVVISDVNVEVPEGAVVHPIERDEVERYKVIVAGAQIRVVDTNDGSLVPVNYEASANYLLSDAPSKEALALTTQVDFTYLVNRERVVELEELEEAPIAEDDQGIIIWVFQGNYAVTYRAVLDGETYEFVTPDGSAAEHATEVATNYIAEQLLEVLTDDTPYEVTRINSALHVRRTDGEPIEDPSVEADGGGGNLRLIVDSVRGFDELPRAGVNGFAVRVAGSAETRYDDYWVRYSDEARLWVEVAAPGLRQAIDPSTMPHVLVREADGEFYFRTEEWAGRNAGDENTAPTPSFVGRRINDIFFYQDRLSLLAGENVVCSQSGFYRNFWRNSVRQLLDEDRIDVQASGREVSTLLYAVPFERQLLVFAAKAQYELRFGDVLTPVTAGLVQIDTLQMEPQVAPILAGQRVHFASPQRGGFGVQAVFYGTAGRREIMDIAKHVPGYFKGRATSMVAIPNESTLLLTTSGEPNVLTIYKWYDSDDGRRVQSAWGKWRLPGEILGLAAGQTAVTLLIRYGGDIILGRIAIDFQQEYQQGLFSALLDVRVTHEDVALDYEAGEETTTVYCPFYLTNPEVVSDGTGEFPLGYRFTVNRLDDNTLSVPANLEDEGFWVGESYKSEVVLSPLYRQQMLMTGETLADTRGTTTALRMSISMGPTGYMRAEVTADNATPFVYRYTGIVLGDYLIGSLPGTSAPTLEFSVGFTTGRGEVRLINDTPLPSQLLSATWTGRQTRR